MNISWFFFSAFFAGFGASCITKELKHQHTRKRTALSLVAVVLLAIIALFLFAASMWILFVAASSSYAAPAPALLSLSGLYAGWRSPLTLARVCVLAFPRLAKGSK
ncbi:hypothetical protein [Paludibacterium yongneupense]|uniref:hypothetical protein n=1 Tax=Paludibacterium yongneupense TaxID=400061 RepID=UPI0012EBAEA7|nr:hypothetical protein [Paludibacterium yongneupense]